jgi:hypothetical protein
MQPEAIFRSLADHEVEYVLVGGLAATACYLREDRSISANPAPFLCSEGAQACSLGLALFASPRLTPL